MHNIVAALMRPKGSLEHLHAAVAFANAVTVRVDEGVSIPSSGRVNCRGPRSVFAALLFCAPQIVRQTNATKFEQGAISETELNKFLERSGFFSYRYRHRIKGLPKKWSKGELLWKKVRWLDPTSAEDLIILRINLSEIKFRFPRHFMKIENLVLGFLSKLHSGVIEPSCEDEDMYTNQDDDVVYEHEPVTAAPCVDVRGDVAIENGLSLTQRDTTPSRCAFGRGRLQTSVWRQHGRLQTSVWRRMESVPYPCVATPRRCVRCVARTRARRPHQRTTALSARRRSLGPAAQSTHTLLLSSQPVHPMSSLLTQPANTLTRTSLELIQHKSSGGLLTICTLGAEKHYAAETAYV